MFELSTFTHAEFGAVRGCSYDDMIWVVGRDVAVALGYKHPSNAVLRHVDEDDRRIETAVTNDKISSVMLINESGLYALTLRSQLPCAKMFRKWVTSEVLPSIRRTGQYSTNSLPRMTDREVCALLAQSKRSNLDYLIRYLGARGYDVPAMAVEAVNPSVDDILHKFVLDVLPQCAWDLLPFGFLYELYKSWFSRSDFGFDIQPMGRNTFIRCLYDLCKFGQVPDWTCPGRQTPIRPKNLMLDYEPLVDTYHLDSHWNHGRKSTYNGLLRRPAVVGSN